MRLTDMKRSVLGGCWGGRRSLFVGRFEQGYETFQVAYGGRCAKGDGLRTLALVAFYGPDKKSNHTFEILVDANEGITRDDLHFRAQPFETHWQAQGLT